MKKILTVMCLLLTFIVCGCECTLHTHYYNDYGVCGTCGHDIAYELTYENGEYIVSNQYVEPNTTYYYKFTSHGENGVNFNLESEDVKFDRIEIRAKGMLQTVPTRNDDTNKFYSYDKNLNDGTIYYLKVTYWGTGTISMKINSIES